MAPVETLLAELQTPVEAPRSPIIASLAAVSSSIDRTAPARRIVLVSDLLENSTAFSAYRDRVDVTRVMASDAYAVLLDANLEGVEVDIVMLYSEGSGHRQTDALTQLWVEIIEGAGGRAVLLPQPSERVSE